MVLYYIRCMVNLVRCLSCGSVIESHTRWDYKWCDCHSVYIDGGPEYQRIGGLDRLIEVWVLDRFIPLSILINQDPDDNKFNDHGSGI